jgi:SAM-dependent methyltransferase
MRQPSPPTAGRQKLLVNLGCGWQGTSWLPALFSNWRELRVDVDPEVAPDVVADITDLSPIETGMVDAIWSSHCVEHVYLHQVRQAVAEAYRVLRDDGFWCMIVPDLQAIAHYMANDRLHEVVYEAPAGPVTAHDMIFGHGLSIARGRTSMAHRCGFTPTLLLQQLQTAPFAEFVVRRRPNQQELAAIALKQPSASDAAREAFLASLEL